MIPVFDMTWLGTMLVAVVVIGVVALLCAGRRTRLVTLVLLGLLVVPGLFYFRLRASVAPQAATLALPAAGFEPSAEQLSHARMFPSTGQAAAQLVVRVADSLGNLPEGLREPARIEMTIPDEIRPHVTAAVRTAFPRVRQSFDPKPTTRPAGAGNVQLRIEVNPDPRAMGQSPSAPRRGTVNAVASSEGGTVEKSVQFIDKPWAGDAGTAQWKGAGGTIVARSQAPCTSAADALTQAREVATAELRELIVQRLITSGRADVGSDEPWFSNRIRSAVHSPRFTQDEFFQEMVMPYGSVFRACVLVSTSADNISHLCNELSAERRQQTVHTLSTAGAIGALSVLILLVYLFLNAVTRGYFTLRLRLVAFGLLAAAVLLVLMVA